VRNIDPPIRGYQQSQVGRLSPNPGLPATASLTAKFGLDRAAGGLYLS